MPTIPPSIRNTLCIFLIGLTVGVAVDPFLAPPKEQPATNEDQWSSHVLWTTPSNQDQGIPANKMLPAIQQRFDKSTLVFLADETVDVPHRKIRYSVIEVWKGAASYTGQVIEAPWGVYHYDHHKPVERVLVSIAILPGFDARSWLYVDGDTLRNCREVTLDGIKEHLAKGSTQEGSKYIPFPALHTSHP